MYFSYCILGCDNKQKLKNHMHPNSGVSVLLMLLFMYAVMGQGLDLCPGQHEETHPQVLNPGLCLQLTSNPIFDGCPDLIIRFPFPNYCGLMPDGTWRNFTYTCEAKKQAAIGFIPGQCSCARIGCVNGLNCYQGECTSYQDACASIDCPPGRECVDGVCINPSEPQPSPEPQPEPEPTCETDADCSYLTFQKCLNNKCVAYECPSSVGCPQYQDCQYGVCFKKFTYFCSKVYPLLLRYYCPVQRFTPYECPPFNQIDNFFGQFECGVTKDEHKLINYPKGCSCKRDYIQFYYDMPCQYVPANTKQCSDSEECVNNQCVLIDFCKNVHCPPNRFCNNGLCLPLIGYCANHADCPPGQICNPYNYCEEEVIVDPCEQVTCADGQKCTDGQCVGLCDDVYCPPQTQCREGYCYTINPRCTSDQQCQANEVCLLGRCREYVGPQPDCRLYGCSNPLHTCYNGQCRNCQVEQCGSVSTDCNIVGCPSGLACLGNGECVGLTDCRAVGCPPYHQCQTTGECVSYDPCQNVYCLYGQCENGQCPAAPSFGSFCVSNSNCPNTEVCVSFFCRRLPCVYDSGCYGHKCYNGYCFNDAYI